jgi:hypothetical protein
MRIIDRLLTPSKDRSKVKTKSIESEVPDDIFDQSEYQDQTVYDDEMVDDGDPGDFYLNKNLAPSIQQEDEDLEPEIDPSRTQFLSEVALLVSDRLPEEFVSPAPVPQAGYKPHPLLVMSTCPTRSFTPYTLSGDLSTREIILDPLDNALQVGLLDKKYFSLSLPSKVVSTFQSHAHAFPYVSELPKDMSFFKKPSGDELDSVREIEKMIFHLGTLQQQNQVLLHALTQNIVSDVDHPISTETRNLLSALGTTVLPMSDLVARLQGSCRLRQRDLHLRGNGLHSDTNNAYRRLPLFEKDLFPADLSKIYTDTTEVKRSRQTSEAMMELLKRSHPNSKRGGSSRGGSSRGSVRTARGPRNQQRGGGSDRGKGRGNSRPKQDAGYSKGENRGRGRGQHRGGRGRGRAQGSFQEPASDQQQF